MLSLAFLEFPLAFFLSSLLLCGPCNFTRAPPFKIAGKSVEGNLERAILADVWVELRSLRSLVIPEGSLARPLKGPLGGL